MLRQMCWLPMMGPDGEKVLHIRTHLSQPWQPYTACPEHAVPDYNIPKGSKGWTTYQKLVLSGWTLLPNTQAQKSALSR